MGGYMYYFRMRERNSIAMRPEGLLDNPERVDPYNIEVPELHGIPPTLIGDINRMERDYLGLNDWVNRDPETKKRYLNSPPDPGEEIAQMTGVALEDVRAVLYCLFTGEPLR